ncbi:hypothetical protein QUA40_05180 [Microcoleus sp. Pol11C3]|uniref:hypothetical protein n=1 Tax=Microcoleus sp. Pol11C3 TaxID=3055390 RepID=UPI002FD387D4
MSRNMIEANEYIFKILAEFVQSSEADVPVSNNKRCIKTNTKDKEWLQELKIINKQLILPNFQTASFEFKSHKYFVAVGWQSKQTIDSDEVIEFVELNAGIVTALLFELKIPLSHEAKPYDIADKILYDDPINSIIKYEDYSLISNVFEPFSVYRIPEDSAFIEKNDLDLIRISGFYALKNSQLIALNFSRETLDKFENVFFEGSESIPYENLLFSLVSVSWKYSFLDIYRCIERLFSIAFWADFHKNLKIEDSLLKFSADLENHTQWKPKEIDAVNKLIKDSPEEACRLLKEIKSFIDGTEAADCGDLVYKIRNSIVHFRPANQSINLDDKNWDMLIRASLYIVEYWYKQYDEQLTLR